MRQLLRFLCSFAPLISLTVCCGTASAAPHFYPGTPGEYFTAKGGPVTFEIKGGPSITCKKIATSPFDGRLVTSTRATASFELQECSFIAPGLGIASLGDANKVILLSAELELCYVNEFSKQVGMVIRPLQLHLEVPAVKLLILIDGAVVAGVTPVNVTTYEYSLAVAQKAGEQAIRECGIGFAIELTSSIDGGIWSRMGVGITGFVMRFLNSQDLIA